MEAVFADAVLAVVFVRERIHVVDGRDRLVERGVEYGNLRYARKHVLDREDSLQVGRVVQRCDLEERADLLLDLVGYQTACGEELSAVSDAVADRLHLVERTDYTVPGIGQCIQYQTDTRRVVGDGLMEFEPVLPDRFMREVSFGRPMR